MAKSLVSQKIEHLRHAGEPQDRAVAMAINMGKAGRLRPGGRYVHVRKSNRTSSRSSSRR